jgi:cellobiose transport system permease protein
MQLAAIPQFAIMADFGWVLNTVYVKDYSVVMAGTLVAVVPLLVVFLFGARHFVRNIAAGALKG